MKEWCKKELGFVLRIRIRSGLMLVRLKLGSGKSYESECFVQCLGGLIALTN